MAGQLFDVFVVGSADPSPAGETRLASALSSKHGVPLATVAKAISAKNLRAGQSLEQAQAQALVRQLQVMGAVTVIRPAAGSPRASSQVLSAAGRGTVAPATGDFHVASRSPGRCSCDELISLGACRRGPGFWATSGCPAGSRFSWRCLCSPAAWQPPRRAAWFQPWFLAAGVRPLRTTLSSYSGCGAAKQWHVVGATAGWLANRTFARRHAHTAAGQSTPEPRACHRCLPRRFIVGAQT